MNPQQPPAPLISFLHRHHAILLGTLAAVAVASVIGWFYLDSRYPSWHEEVRLSDGRVITIHQRHEVFDNYGTNQSWVEIDLPELGGKRVWHSYLMPQRVDVVDGEVFLFGSPRGIRQNQFYRYPKHYMVAFKWTGDGFSRVPFLQLPHAIRRSENTYPCVPERVFRPLTLQHKDKTWCADRGDKWRFGKSIVLDDYESLAKFYAQLDGVAPMTD